MASALPLLVARIALANDIDDAAAADDLALLTNPFNAGPDLHDRRLILPRSFAELVESESIYVLVTVCSTPFGTIFADARKPQMNADNRR